MSAGVGPDVGLRLLKAFNHFVFIDSELGTVPESFLSFLIGDPGSDGRPKNSSFCERRIKSLLEQCQWFDEFLFRLKGFFCGQI